jgi:hypothetical protein
VEQGLVKRLLHFLMQDLPHRPEAAAPLWTKTDYTEGYHHDDDLAAATVSHAPTLVCEYSSDAAIAAEAINGDGQPVLTLGAVAINN